MTPQEIKLKKKLVQVRSTVRGLILADKLDQARDLCSHFNLELNDCLLDAVYGAPEVITKKESPPVSEPKPEPESKPVTVKDSGQPVVAEVYSKPINPRLIGIILPDGRKSLLWKTNNHSIGSKILVRLEEEVGDTSYYREI